LLVWFEIELSKWTENGTRKGAVILFCFASNCRSREDLCSTWNEDDEQNDDTSQQQEEENPQFASGEIITQALTHEGSLELQSMLSEGPDPLRVQIMTELQSDLNTSLRLVTDDYGCNLIQTMVQNVTEDELMDFIMTPSLQKNLFQLSCDPRSSVIMRTLIRKVCEALPIASDGYVTRELSQFLEDTRKTVTDNLTALSCDENGSQVVLSFLNFHPEALKDRFCSLSFSGGCNFLMTNQYGHRVLLEALKLRKNDPTFISIIRFSVWCRFLEVTLDQYGCIVVEQLFEMDEFRELRDDAVFLIFNRKNLSNFTTLLASENCRLPLMRLVEFACREQFKFIWKCISDLSPEVILSTVCGSDFMAMVEYRIEMGAVGDDERGQTFNRSGKKNNSLSFSNSKFLLIFLIG
jgi:hypothetical protein